MILPFPPDIHNIINAKPLAKILRECLPDTMCHVSCVTCHMSHITCHVSPVTCKNKKNYVFIEEKKGRTKLDKGVELVGGGSVMNGPTPSGYLLLFLLISSYSYLSLVFPNNP